MPKYKVKFEICGKYMMIAVEAESQYRAEVKVRNRLNIISTELIEEPTPDNPVDFLKGMFGMK